MILYGSGMPGFIGDELELGTRVAMCLDSENNGGWSALDDLSYELWFCGSTPPTDWAQSATSSGSVDRSTSNDW